MGDVLTVPVAACITHSTVPFSVNVRGWRGWEESAAGILLAAILLGLAALVVMTVLRQSVQRT